jgi:hypothetical protein
MSDWWKMAARKLASGAQQREREEFARWLQSVGQPEPDMRTASSRLRDLYEFFEWMRDHNAVIDEVLPSGIVAADGPEVRRWEPDGGLTIEDWPYLRVCCGSEDDDLTETNRNEIMEAILTNRLQRLGHPFGVASSAVDKFDHQRDEVTNGHPLWSVVEEWPFDEIVAHVDELARGIADELREHRRKIKSESHCPPDGPDDRISCLWWRGEPYILPPMEFRLVSVLWAASGHSLPVWEVLQKVWDDRPAAIDESYVHKVHERKSKANKVLMETGITISISTDWTGGKRVTMEVP